MKITSHTIKRLLFLLVFLVSACGSADPMPTVPSQVIIQATGGALGSTSTVMLSPVPSATISPVPTLTATVTLTSTPTLHPMNILAMRQRIYPGSEISIEETLEPGINYNRFIASYLSEGLKIYALLTIPDGEEPPSGWPAIVFNHGYIPPDQYRTTERYIAYVDWLARSGYIVFRIDYRGHDRSEGEA